ncbi:MAG: class I SAM-dependent methyltransferase [Betaproteobacteria bacterium]|nr:methyltransferase domain-containing protein [Betaproteobacteria bacterium]MBU6514202.1 methyltransferase domain-containing protein [Betaproteobacteria bacterium]MDE1955759.1 class I SAM-dependent methyltransferase [Betaproteobacteria bacterium]MDE2154248.1 class I SAM-dependent methyltransferase [Betaproteobacteria bacterium]MDE2477377.1 class I SAM-dependent methyltransferase [Betaproteobacteria bacterium]
MTNVSANGPARGWVLRSTHARLYDLGSWLLLRGRARGYRQGLLELAGVGPGSRVLDVGCGTGSLVLESVRAGAAQAIGVDASPDMLGIARRKAMRAGWGATFTQASAEDLPCADASCDVVFNTIMLHHLPQPARLQCAREMRRVLKPGGRLLVVEFGAGSSGAPHGRRGHGGRHGHVPAAAVARVLLEAGLTVLESGPIGVRDLHYTLARPARP